MDCQKLSNLRLFAFAVQTLQLQRRYVGLLVQEVVHVSRKRAKRHDIAALHKIFIVIGQRQNARQLLLRLRPIALKLAVEFCQLSLEDVILDFTQAIDNAPRGQGSRSSPGPDLPCSKDALSEPKHVAKAKQSSNRSQTDGAAFTVLVVGLNRWRNFECPLAILKPYHGARERVVNN